MKTKLIALGIATSFIAALFDIMAGIYMAVLTNTFCNYIVISRQKKVTTKVKKSRPMTVDEFRQREMEAHPHRNYPNVQEFTD